MQQSIAAERDAAAMLDVVRRIAPAPLVDHTGEIFGTSDRLITRYKGASVGGLQSGMHASCWLDDRHRRLVADQLDRGNAAVIVEAREFQHWRDATQALLQHATHPVLGIIRPLDGASMPPLPITGD